MSRRGRAADRRRRKDLLGFLVIVGVALTLGAVATAAATLRTPDYDTDTLCLVDATPPAHTLVLLDATDRLTVAHRKRAQSVVEEEMRRLPRWGRLTVAMLNPDAAGEPRRLFSGCTPGDRRTANPLFENVKALETQKRESFDDAVAASLKRAFAPRKSDASPLVEGLYAAVADPEFSTSDKRRLVLVSDLMQFTPDGFSLYKGGDFAAYQASPGALRTPPDLSDVDVRVTPLERRDKQDAQAQARAVFWPAYFAESGARSVAFDR